MRALCLTLFALVTMSSTLSPQDSVSPSFVVRVKYIKIDLPRDSTSTCLAVLPDRHFHMEQASKWPDPAARIFEGSLPDQSFDSLSKVLAAQDLKDLRVTDTGLNQLVEGEMFVAMIPREKQTQTLVFVANVGGASQPARSFPAPLLPLVEWVHATAKFVQQQKLQPLKKSKPTNCWLTGHL